MSTRPAAGPALLLVVVTPVAFVVIAGIGSALLQSIGLMPLVGPVRLSLDAYVGGRQELADSLGVSVGIAAASTTLSSFIGTLVAILVVSGGWCGRIVATLSAATITVPHLIGAATIGLLLADSGVLSRLLNISPDAWPALVGGPWWVAVVTEYAWKESAFIAMIVAGTLATRVARFDETASLLGAGRLARLRLVFLPLARPSLIIASTITFVYTLGSYEVAWLLGRTYPEPLAVMALRLFHATSLASRPEAAAVAVVTVSLSVLVVTTAFLALRRSGAWR
ncbi:putative spermidine/putrescine transport system permease protein [Mycetocola sp. CAN_C7]|uniref:ABC transporter permease subunit n=1 Tax=Mycetocola sp. CAN_C7 TaxID=2787724 RepID=UPI0018CBBEED